MYLDYNRLEYAVKVSKGKGKPTEEFKILLWKICVNMGYKLMHRFNNNRDIHHDCMMTSYEKSYFCYKGLKDGMNPFFYISECVKRAYVSGFNLTTTGKYSIPDTGEEITFVRILDHSRGGD